MHSGILFIAIAALNGFLAVALGAFGAHWLDGSMAPERFVTYQKAVHYQALHALALLGCGLLIEQHGLIERHARRLLNLAGWAWAWGIGLFSGSLYLLAFTGIRSLGVITPLGGVAMLVGWATLTYAAWRALRMADGN